MPNHCASRRIVGAGERKDRAGQQYGLHVGCTQRIEDLGSDGFKMICGTGVQLGGQSSAGAGAKLLGVQAQFEAGRGRR